MEGLKDSYPDEAERREHIFKNQLYALPITQLTAYMSRRTVYYSKDATKEGSVVQFDSPDGNIRYTPTSHTFIGGKCRHCGQAEGEGIGARQIDGSLETHAYQFIHLTEQEASSMKFDVIVGNPPYQLDTGGRGAQATPIYHKFVEQAKSLKPRYMAFIIPSRWFSGGMGLNEFRTNMLNDRHISALYDYPDSSDCFPGVEIKGGVMYYIWDKNYDGDCEIHTISGDDELPVTKRPLNEFDTFIRHNQAIPILRKVLNKNEETLDKKVSGINPFNFATNFKDFDQINNPDKVKIYANKKTGYIRRERIQSHPEWIDKHKVLISEAYGAGEGYPHQILGKPLLTEPPSCCTFTYLVPGVFDSKKQAENFTVYLKSRFFRFLVSLKKNTQHSSSKVFSFVPDLPMNEEWTDEKLYARYDIDADEQAFIESMIKEMVWTSRHQMGIQNI